jgi:hypothetical protein
MGDRLDKVSPLLRERIRVEVDRRILTPALERDDFCWMGFTSRKDVNNWNPWIASNWLASALILERDPQRRVRTVHRIMRSLDVFMNGYPDDGGCDEGPSYWDRAGASLFDNLELLRGATNVASTSTPSARAQHGAVHLPRVHQRAVLREHGRRAGRRCGPIPSSCTPTARASAIR